MRIHILDDLRSNDSPDARRRYQVTHGHWYPVLLAEQILHGMGVEVAFYSRLDADSCDCDSLLISSRHHDYLFGTAHKPLLRAETVATLRARVPRIIWFDLRDSSGTTQFEVLPYVDLYVKQYCLRDMSAYRRPMYGGRVFTEFEHQRFGIEDRIKPGETPDQESDFTTLDREDEQKVVVGWDLSYHWRSCLPWPRNDFHDPPLPRKPEFLYANEAAWESTLTERNIKLSAMLTARRYQRATVVNQRTRALHILAKEADPLVQVENLPAATYLKTLRNSRAVLSCFGNGEVCYREHEGWIAGAAVIMPDMGHITTFPPRYAAHQTYHPVRWSLEDLVAGIERLEEDAAYRLFLAEAGQRAFKTMFERDGLASFAQRFVVIVQGKRPEPVG